MTSFSPSEQHEHLKSSIHDALKEVLNIDTPHYKMNVGNITFDDKYGHSDYKTQKDAKLKGQTWAIPVFADLTLKDKETGKIISKVDKTRIMNMPMITDRNSYIVGGNEYQVMQQLRLKPGVYMATTKAGDIKAQVNLAKGGVGKNLGIEMDEDKFVLTARQAEIPLYDLLRGLGTTHNAIKEQWGAKAADVNALKFTDALGQKAVKRFEQSFTSGEDAHKFMSTRTAIDAATTKQALGIGYDKLHQDLLMRAAGKLLRVKAGDEPMVDRDSIFHKTVHGSEDFIKERLLKKQLMIKNKISRKIERSPDLTRAITPGTFAPLVERFFSESDKAINPEQTNPLSMICDQEKITILGEGGLSGESHQVTPEMREVHPTHLGFIDPIQTPESDKIGATLHIPIMTKKVGNELHTPVINLKTGAHTYLSPIQMYGTKVAFADQFGSNGKPIASKIKMYHEGQVQESSSGQAHYRFIAPQHMFSTAVNLIPFLSSVQGNRAMMAGKHMTQAIPLVDREAPLVQVQASPTNKESFEKQIGKKFSLHSPVDGTVTKIEKDAIYIKSGRDTQKIDTYNNFHLNQNTFMQHNPTVAVEQKVTKGSLIADSNYTKDGTLALGRSMRTAFIPYKGYNFEDGIVITDTASKKLTSEHIFKEHIRIDSGIILNTNKFRSEYPNQITAESAMKLGDDGIIRKGTHVKYGDVLFAGLRLSTQSIGASIHKSMATRYSMKITTWDHEDPGEVIDVQKVGDEITLYIKTAECAKIGDKLALRHGNKGVITHIIEDAHAPCNSAGEPVEIMLNPHGVIGRINVSQLYESATGKVAKKLGSPITVENFQNENYLDKVNALMKKTGIQDKEILKDPTTGKTLGNVHVGNPYILKLFKQSSKSYSARGYGPGSSYTSENQPGGSGEEGSKSLDVLTLYAMLAHGSRENLREMASIKGERNDEYWEALKTGQKLPAPKVPFIFEKFKTYLQGAGVNVQKNGNELSLIPMTDTEVGKLSKMQITEPAFIMGKQLREIKGGFLDPAKLGGIRGTNWGHLEFKEPIVNPVFEKAIRSLTNLKATEFESIASGQKTVDVNGKPLTGGSAIKALLKNVNVKDELEDVTVKLKTAKKSNLDELNRKYRYLKVLSDNHIKPEEAYVNHKIPIIPPNMRQINTTPRGDIVAPQVNYLYASMGVMNKMTELPVMKLLNNSNKAGFNKELYEHASALRGLDSVSALNKEVTGYIGEIAGDSPKTGMFQNKILKKQQDLVGRGVILPEPSLGIDEVGLPKNMLWKLYEPFVTKSLVRYGMGLKEARQEVEKKTPQAERALLLELKSRPVMLNRAPSLHKFNIMGFNPTPVEGKSIKIPSLIVAGFNADFDGDTMTVHVPISDKAVQEAREMMPSKNLYKPGTGALMLMPTNEAMLGIYLLSKDAEGRAKLNAVLPAKYHVTSIMTKNSAKDLFMSLSKELQQNTFADVLNKIKRLGENASYDKGVTLGISDISISPNRNKIVNQAVHAYEKDPSSLKGHTDALKVDMMKHLGSKKSNFFDMIESGASGKINQVMQITAAPLYVKGYKGQSTKIPIKKSYAEGLDSSDYWTAAYGARSGMIDRQVQTSEPGAFSKELMSSVIDQVVSTADCGTHRGIDISIDSAEAYDRYTAGDQHGILHNTLITPEILKTLRQKHIAKIHARSPLTCEAVKGICRHCTGIDETGKLPQIGENVGAKQGQALAEPLTQMTMRTFHTGGLAGTGISKSGFERIEQLLQIPKYIAGEAPLALNAGKVTHVGKGIAGLTNITVKNNDGKVVIYHAPKDAHINVSAGHEVDKGEVLSTGTIKPQKLLATKGMLKAQQYIVDELKSAYKEQGADISAKTFETIVRATGNFTQITKSSPHAPEFVPGDIASHTAVAAFNRNLVVDLPVNNDLIGYSLDEAVGAKLPVGHLLTSEDEIKYIRQAGHTHLRVRKQAIGHEPTLKGINTIPLFKKDWLAHMGYNRINLAITEGGSAGWKSDISGYHPIPAFAHAANFGLGSEGKY